ncbi:hypothetical protein O6H91_Y500000 [Diphasiastrum complanatum]|nr:hypothetical protein O6H91_Y500000 [Diphasiastrum complanatum]
MVWLLRTCFMLHRTGIAILISNSFHVRVFHNSEKLRCIYFYCLTDLVGW